MLAFSSKYFCVYRMTEDYVCCLSWFKAKNCDDVLHVVILLTTYLKCGHTLPMKPILIYSGYRCFKMVMFFSGFLFGVAAVILLYHKEPVLEVQLGTETKAGIGLGVGVLCGLMTMLVSTMGLILSGVQLGALLALPILVAIGQFHSLTPVWVPLSVVLAASIVTAIFTLQWQKLFTIIYTSVFGATTVMLCVDYLVGSFMLPDEVYDILCQATPRPLCWFHWAITGICPVLSLIGVLMQWNCTGKGVSHTEGKYNLNLMMHSGAFCFHAKIWPTEFKTFPCSVDYSFPLSSFSPPPCLFGCSAAVQKKQKQNTRNNRHRESRRGPQSHRRRRPPPLKRYAGDVLAPVSSFNLLYFLALTINVLKFSSYSRKMTENI